MMEDDTKDELEKTARAIASSDVDRAAVREGLRKWFAKALGPEFVKENPQRVDEYTDAFLRGWREHIQKETWGGRGRMEGELPNLFGERSKTIWAELYRDLLKTQQAFQEEAWAKILDQDAVCPRARGDEE